MAHRSSPVRPIGWLTIVGLACLASTALLRRSQRRLSVPERVYRRDSDVQKRCYA